MNHQPSGVAARSVFVPILVSLLSAAALVGGCGGDEPDQPAPEGDYGAFYGVAPEGQLNTTDYSRMAAGGVGTVRVVIQWSTIETAEGVYDWSATDRLLSDIAVAGMEPMATVFGTPAIYAETAIEAPTNDEKTLDAWDDFLAAAASRYGFDGEFWSDFSAANPEVVPQPIREWEIWNEPNSSVFWSPTPDPEAYALLVNRSADVLDEADSKAQLMTGGMFATPQSDGAIVSYDFIADLLAQDGVDAAVDIVGLHPYGPDVDAVTDQVADSREAVDEAGSNADLWVTEIGWGSNPDAGGDLSKTPEQQAELLSDSFEELYGSRERWGLGGVVWYTWHDSIEDTVGECGWCATAGLVDAERDSKPAWLAFTDLTGGAP